MQAELDVIELGERVVESLARDNGPRAALWLRARLQFAEYLPYVD